MRSVLATLTMLFFAMGLLTSLNDILIPHFKAAFDLHFRDAALIQSSFFAAYFIVSFPAGAFTARYGYRAGLATSLWLAGVGCALFFPAASLASYGCFLVALFVLASGITLLQVAVNAYVNTLGARETAASRLTLVQAFNSLGTTIGPPLGALWILAPLPGGAHALDAVRLPYGILAACLFIGGIIIAIMPLSHGKMTAAAPGNSQKNFARCQQEERMPRLREIAVLFAHRPLRYGIGALFLYVGAEVSIGSFLIVYLMQPETGVMTHQTASHYLALYWGGAMVGRFVGAAILRHVRPGAMLAVCALLNAAMIVSAWWLPPSQAMVGLMACGLGNAIMFPTIFSLSVDSLGERVSQASGLLCMAIVGGAVVPYLQGVAADVAGLSASFCVPLLCYLCIAAFGVYNVALMRDFSRTSPNV